MPGNVKVKILSARNLPVMDRATFLTDAFVELCIGNITYKTEVARRSLNPSWNTDWFCFELDDQALQEEALLLKVMDHDTYSAHDTIGRVYFDLNPLLSRGQTRCLNGWFPIYDTMHGIRGEISLAIRVDVFLDASRYRQSSLGVRFFHCCAIPQGFLVESFIGFVQELVMNDDPEHQWIEKIRTSRASNEARQRLFSRLSGELQRKMGLKVLDIGGNSVIGYQLHFDLEGETGVVVRGIGTAVRLRRIRPMLTPPNSPSSSKKNYPSKWKYSPDYTESPTFFDTDGILKASHPGPNLPISVHQPLELGEFPFLTISHPPAGLVLHFGSIVASKSVKLLDKNTPAGIQFRDAWWLELRTEVSAHMYSVSCNAVIAYREECFIYEDVCILSGYGTAVAIDPTWTHKFQHIKEPCSQTFATLQKASDQILNSTSNHSRENYFDKAPTASICTQQSNTSETKYFTQPMSTTTPICFSPSLDFDSIGNAEPTHCNRQQSNPHQTNVTSNCHICHLPPSSELSTNGSSFSTSSRCGLCKAASVPDLLFSSTEFPSELVIIGKPALIQARICRSKKDTKGEVAANELSELLPFIDYELHYRLMQKMRLCGMNALFGLKFRLAVGEYMIAAIATGTGVFLPALPPPPPPKVFQATQATETPENQFARAHLQKKVDDYLRRSRKLYGLPSFASRLNELITETPQNTIKLDDEPKSKTSDPHVCNLDNSFMVNRQPDPVLQDLGSDNNSNNNNGRLKSNSSVNTVFLETREPEPEELAVLLKDPLQPSGILLTTTECIPAAFSGSGEHSMEDHTSLPSSWNHMNSFVRFHEAEPTSPDSFFETSSFSVMDVNSLYSEYTANTSGVLNQCNPSSTCNASSPIKGLQSHIARPKQQQQSDLSGMVQWSTNCLGRILSEFNQLTWFRFRHHFPCWLNALDYRLTFTDDDHVQVVSTGMVLNSNPKSSETSVDETPITKRRSFNSSMLDHTSVNPAILPSELSTKPECLPDADVEAPQLNGCLLTPLSTVPNTYVEAYLGNLDFFFIRETTDLREVGGLCGFMHTSLSEVQAVVGAHTASLGGNALLSYHLSEVVVLKPTSRNQAQCLLNVCGDMAKLTSLKMTKSTLK